MCDVVRLVRCHVRRIARIRALRNMRRIARIRTLRNVRGIFGPTVGNMVSQA